MITLRRLTDRNSPEFRELISVYTEAFPEEERRDIEQLEQLLECEPAMYFNAIECDGELAGLFVYWDFISFYYLEHLAVYANMRNKKIGQQLLDWVKEHLQGVRLLEVEPAETEIAERRINYYQRNDYYILDKDYKQPSYREGGDEFPLWIMGNETSVSKEQMIVYEQIIKDKVYYRK